MGALTLRFLTPFTRNDNSVRGAEGEQGERPGGVNRPTDGSLLAAGEIIGYLATNPASLTLATDAIDDALLKSIAMHPGVAEAEPRRTVSGRLKVGPVQWRNLMLFVAKDYGDVRVSTLKPEQGAWPPAAGEILIERDAMQVARTRIGDTLTIKTGRGNEQTLRVSGSVGQAQARMENIVYGYITLDALERLGEEPYLDRLNVVVTGNKFDEQHVRSVAEDVRSLVEDRGHPVRRVDVPQPGKHPHSDLMKRPASVVCLSQEPQAFSVSCLSV